jgi:DNA invertase Pin-like site-specific DNA recombinase
MQENKEQIDTSKLKYALYARKSTEGEGRQVRSIGDQIKDCEKLAKELGVQVVKPYIEETKSAKTPGRRPKFTQMLKDIQANKYQGILCWHPDRLARNMIEAGQIIDMLDNGVIKDLRFHSHQFSNDANGKMLLGMLFVFSKHYSDDLSAKVSRGVKNNFAEGKASGVPKHGYKPDDLGLYVPDTTHSLIVQSRCVSKARVLRTYSNTCKRMATNAKLKKVGSFKWAKVRSVRCSKTPFTSVNWCRLVKLPMR